MKQLFKSHNATTLFFNDETASQEISVWMSHNLELFGLNESYSCKVEVIDDSNILITGDEDMVEFQINKINVIDVSNPYNYYLRKCSNCSHTEQSEMCFECYSLSQHKFLK